VKPQKHQRAVRVGEALALTPEALQSAPGAIWWDYYTPIPSNERVGDDGRIAVVHVRGSLDHHSGYGCDSYESIRRRVASAICGEDQRPMVGWWSSREEEAAAKAWNPSPPDYVVLRIDSPGGVVSGLNECVYALRRMSEDADIPLVAYVDELATSAAYALACACEGGIFMPASGICGSVGVISAMYDVTEADKKMGVRFVTLTSGKRKADGHPHVPIEDAAIAAEQGRVDRLAKQFFRLVAGVRQLGAKELRGYEAGIFLGAEAKTARLVDGVMGWDELIATLAKSGTEAKKAIANMSHTGSVSETTAPRATKGSQEMNLANLVTKTKAQLAAEKDPKKRKALAASLSKYEAALEAFKKEKHTIEKHETEEGEEDDEDEESEEEESEEEEEESAKGNETDRKEDEGEGDDDDGEGDDSDEEGDDDDAKKSKKAKYAAAPLVRLAQQATGKTGRAAVGALAAKLAAGERALAMVEQISKERRAEKKANLIASALNAHKITRHEAKNLGKRPLSFVTSFLEMRPKAIIASDDDSLLIPAPGGPEGSASALPPEVAASVEQAVSCAPEGIDREKLRSEMIAAHQKRMSASLNGAGRY